MTAPDALEAFFVRPSLDVAVGVLGAVITCRGVSIRLTEVEAYAGMDDPASHAYRGPTPRAAVMFGRPARVYVYLSHGLHHCMNLVCGPEGTASAILLRAGEVVEGLETARSRRGSRIAAPGLARGPGNLAGALGIELADSGTSLADGPVHFDARGGVGRPGPELVRRGPRVGVRDAADVAWRLWLDGEPTVSAYRRNPRAPVA